MAGSNLSNQSYAANYTSFTGTDIMVVFQGFVVTTAQGISYSITRQKAPIYTMGSADFRATARSKRGIAGSIILANTDRSALAGIMMQSEFAAKKHSIETTMLNPIKNFGKSRSAKGAAGQTIQTSPLNPTLDGSVTSVSELLSDFGSVVSDGANEEDLGSEMSEVATPMYADQLLPFDVTLVGANEYGNSMAMRIFCLEILNEGSGMSVDDVSNESQITYMAKWISPWTPQKSLASKI